MNAGIEIDVQLRNGSGHLGTHLNGDDRIDSSRGLHGIIDVTALDLGREVLRLHRPIQTKSNEQSR
jgi:hypothetical protein